ncbi:MAG: DUF3575 domain-containing protein [Prevotella sp.]|nr:DUF3575 domain-containing protein [Prevotella sp.]
MKQHLLTTILTILLYAAGANSQTVAVKSNLLYDATASINIGAEIGLSTKWTAELSGNINAWNMSHGRKWKHWFLQPEARYWLCDRFSGHFFAAHAIGGQYNFGHLNNSISIFGTDLSPLSDSRYQGWFAGAGIAYGYAWAIGRHWNLEGELGIGWIYTRYDRFECAGCGKKEEKDRNKNFIAPTKAAVNLVYIF